MTRPTPNRARPISAEVIIFPLNRRIGKVPHVALLYSRRSGKDADSYWRTTWNRLFQQLRKLGLPHDQAMREMEAFTEAVRAELTRITFFTNSNRPDGAA
jgi:hypothetical protein